MAKKKLTEDQQKSIAKLQAFWSGSASASVIKDYKDGNIRDIDLDDK